MKALLHILIVALAMPTFGQVKISGFVHDEQGTGIPGANVFLFDTYDGGTTNAEGKFEFVSNESGDHLLVVKFVGYKDYRQSIRLADQPLEVSVQLREEINQLEAVTITAGSFSASDENRRTIFKAIDIATTAGATADIAGALNTLPGTQKVGESGRLFVRGGDGSETRTFIDGMLVLDAYGTSAPNTPSRGRFLPFMFKGTSFSTGGYSSEYGQALSSVLVLDSKDEESLSRTDIGLLSVGADVAHTESWDGGSAAGKIQYTNIRPYYGLINQEIDWITPPASIEGSSAYRQKVGKGLVKVYGNINHSDFSLYHHDIADPSVKMRYKLANNYGYLNSFYKTPLSDKWIVRTGASYTDIANSFQFDTVHVTERDRGLHTKAVFEGSLTDRIELRVGSEMIHRNYVAYADTSDVSPEVNEALASVFSEADIYTSNKFIVRAGVRSEYNSRTNQISVDPRASMALKIGVGQASVAYGAFRQSPANEWLRQNPELEPERASHYILNYQLIENNRTFRVEAYYKKYDNLVKAENGLLGNGGHGYAKGFELFWRDNKSLRNVDYWISYSYLDTKRDYHYTPYSVVPTFASAHNFSAVYKHFISSLKSQLSLTYSYGSGRHYNNPNIEGYNSGVTKSYQDLSASVSYLPKPQLIIYVSCTNVLGRDNVFGYEYATTEGLDGDFARRAIRQPAPRFIFLGVFLTLSKNKSISQLPSL